MRPSDNLAAFDWIASKRTPLPASYAENGVPLSCCLPLIFPAYAKILHRIDGAYQNIDDALSPEEQRIFGFSDCQVLEEFVASKRTDASGSRILWEELAAFLKTPFAPEICHHWLWRGTDVTRFCLPRYTSGPADGALQDEELKELAEILSVSSPGTCHFRMAEMSVVATKKPLLYEGALTEAATFFAQEVFQFTPEYWWPEDHSWCVCSDYDLTFTIFAGQQSIVDRLLASEVLECIQVEPHIRVDSNAPLPKALES